MCKNINKGFVQLSVLLSIIFGAIALCSLSYIVIQKYNDDRFNDVSKQTSKDSDLEKLKEEVELLKKEKIDSSSKQSIVQTTLAKSTESKSNDSVKPSSKTDAAIMPVKETDNSTTNSEFSVPRVTQTIFKKPGYYSYGGYEITLVVNAVNEDIYIPKTTSDSTSGVTGFIYSIGGDSFRGKQTSKVDCSIYEANYCWIQKGKTSEVTATIWLTPDVSGNYSVKFDVMNFKRGGVSGKIESFNIDKETQKIYI